MRKLISLLTLLFAFANCTAAQDIDVISEGEIYPKKFSETLPNGDLQIEFVRESETFENWTKLVGFRFQQFPKLNNEPKRAALALIRVTKLVNPAVQPTMMMNPEESEAIVHFLTWPTDGRKFMEFNVFRYAKSNDEKGIVSVQFAYRFQLDDTKLPELAKQIKETQMRLIK